MIKDPKKAFPPDVYALIEKYVGNLAGKKVCVPSNGDNIAAFGFYLLGAIATSCDISANQIANAKKIAEKYHFDINFICTDSMTLDKVKNAEYDLIFTSNGTHVWIDDLPKMYQNFARVLKQDGHFIFFETHPIIRPFSNKTYEIKIKKPYEAIGPFGTIPTFDWRMQDFINALIMSGFSLNEMQEFHSTKDDLKVHNYLIVETEEEKTNWPGDTFDWKNNPWAALPQCFSLCLGKKVKIA